MADGRLWLSAIVMAAGMVLLPVSVEVQNAPPLIVRCFDPTIERLGSGPPIDPAQLPTPPSQAHGRTRRRSN